MSTVPPMPPPSPLSVSGVPEAPKSAVEALGPAWQNTSRILFESFNLRKWLKLGLIAWLAGVMGGRGSVNFPSGNYGGGPSGGGTGGAGGGPPPPFASAWYEITSWFHSHAAAVIGGAIAIGVAVVVLVLVMAYVSSVFRFIFLESVITNKTRIRESWRRNSAEGLSYFLWKLGFGAIAVLAAAILVGGPLLLAFMALGASRGGTGPSGGGIAGMILMTLLAILLAFVAAIILGLISAMTRDFVLPIMYVRRVGVIAGWREYWQLLCAHKGGFALYFLMKIVITFAAGIASLFLTVLGLLVAAIPLGLLAGVGYLVVMAAGIHSWDWAYLWGLVPAGIVILIGLSYWMCCVMLPIPVYYQSYALKYLGYVEPEVALV